MVVIPSSGEGAREGIAVDDELGDELAWSDGETDGLIDGASVVGGVDGETLGKSVTFSTGASVSCLCEDLTCCDRQCYVTIVLVLSKTKSSTETVQLPTKASEEFLQRF